MKNIVLILLLPVFLLKVNTAEGQNYKSSDMKSEIPVYIGTYTKKEGHVDGKAQGIIRLSYHPETRKLEKGSTAVEITNPSYVKTSPDGQFLYAVSELGPGDAASGFVYSYKIGEDGGLQVLSRLSTEGFAPCHIELDRSGKYVFVSNYSGGVVMVYRSREDGVLELSLIHI